MSISVKTIIADSYKEYKESILPCSLQKRYALDEAVTYILPEDDEAAVFKIYAAKDKLIGVVIRSNALFDSNGKGESCLINASSLLKVKTSYNIGSTAIGIVGRIGRCGDTTIAQKEKDLTSEYNKEKFPSVKGAPLDPCRVSSFGYKYSQKNGCKPGLEGCTEKQRQVIEKMLDVVEGYFEEYLPEIWKEQSSELNPNFGFKTVKNTNKVSKVFSGLVVQKNLPTDVHVDRGNAKGSVTGQILLGNKIDKEAALILPEIFVKDPMDQNKLKRMAINTRLGDVFIFRGTEYVHYSRAGKLKDDKSGFEDKDAERILAAFYLNKHHGISNKEHEENKDERVAKRQEKEKKKKGQASEKQGINKGKKRPLDEVWIEDSLENSIGFEPLALLPESDHSDHIVEPLLDEVVGKAKRVKVVQILENGGKKAKQDK